MLIFPYFYFYSLFLVLKNTINRLLWNFFIIPFCKLAYCKKYTILQKFAQWVSCPNVVFLQRIPPVTQSNLLRPYMRLHPFPAQNFTGFQSLRIIIQFSLNTAYTISLSVSLTLSSNSLHSCSSHSKQNTIFAIGLYFYLTMKSYVKIHLITDVY